MTKTNILAWGAVLRARHAALPNEHGAWVFLLSPLVIGLALGGLRPASLLLVAAALAAFLIRQPVTIAVKVLSGRRPKADLPAAGFWASVYGLVAAAAALALALMGYGFLFLLAAPALPVLAWHLWLVSRRAERRQMLVEMLASGALALAAPAAYWVGRGQVDSTGWLLWLLSWAQVAGTILYAYMRLEQRALPHMPSRKDAAAMARPSLLYHLGLLAVVIGLAAGGIVPALLPLAYLIQLAETAWGALHPAVGVKPKAIGIRQLIISSLFTAAVIALWAAG